MIYTTTNFHNFFFHFVIQFILYKCFFFVICFIFFTPLLHPIPSNYVIKKRLTFFLSFSLHCTSKNKFITPWLSCWSCLISMYIHNFNSTYSIWSKLLGSIFSKLSIHCFFSHIEMVSSHALLAREYI